MRVFKNPSNGYTETITGASSLWVALFGMFYLMFKGLWAHVLIWAVAVVGFSVATGGPGAIIALPLASIIYAVTIQKILASRYLRSGWQEVSATES